MILLSRPVPTKDTYVMIIHLKVIDKCFVGTASRLSGVTFEILAQEVRCTSSPSKNVLSKYMNLWHVRIVQFPVSNVCPQDLERFSKDS